LFDSNVSGNQDIYRLELASGALRQLTEHAREDFLAELSPDGDEIAFYSFRAGTRDLYLMACDGRRFYFTITEQECDIFTVELR
jgi:TolB protein